MELQKTGLPRVLTVGWRASLWRERLRPACLLRERWPNLIRTTFACYGKAFHVDVLEVAPASAPSSLTPPPPLLPHAIPSSVWSKNEVELGQSSRIPRMPVLHCWTTLGQAWAMCVWDAIWATLTPITSLAWDCTYTSS